MVNNLASSIAYFSNNIIISHIIFWSFAPVQHQSIKVSFLLGFEMKKKIKINLIFTVCLNMQETRNEGGFC